VSPLGIQPGNALGHSLLGHGAKTRPVVGFATAETEAQTGATFRRWRTAPRCRRWSSRVVDLRAARHRVGPFAVEVGFGHVAVVAGVVAHQYLYGSL